MYQKMFVISFISRDLRLFISPLCPFYYDCHSADSLVGRVEGVEHEIGRRESAQIFHLR